MQGSADRAPSTYRAHLARRADPSRLPDRVRRDADLKVEIGRVFEENFRVMACVRFGVSCGGRASAPLAARWRG